MKVVIFDMYGVINFGSGVSPTVLQTLKTLREDGKIVIILSNASFGSADAVSKYAKKKACSKAYIMMMSLLPASSDTKPFNAAMFLFREQQCMFLGQQILNVQKTSCRIYLKIRSIRLQKIWKKLILPIAAYHRFTVRTEWILMTLFRNWKRSVPIRTCALTMVVNLLSGKVLFVRLFGRWGAKPSFTASRILRFLTGH